jgi:hypothetical protein
MHVGSQTHDQLSPHFSRAEFACKCGCGFDDVDPEFVWFLEALRGYMTARLARDYPLNIISGCRCAKHNRNEGGKDTSRHLPPKSKAADIECSDERERFLLISKAIELGVRGIGITATRLHFDIDTKGNKAIWTF